MTQPIDPKKTALVLLDFQASSLAFLADASPLLEKCRSTIDLARRAGAKIAYVRVAFEDADVKAFPSTSMMGERIRQAGPKMLIDSPATAIASRVAPLHGDIVVRKTRIGPFSTTTLHRDLRAAGVDTILFAGVHTGAVVLTGVRDAHDLDYRVFVIEDLCGDPDDDVHRFLVDRVFPRQASIVSTQDLPALLTGTGRSAE